ncbi:MAG: hypothetical protein COX19_12645 [Desulfobacterales bacterium CG23_combo_of_CG06-09_8_20_14_all_51_8]|nr:MAG: hypothetical protein COX19_12645 [Desulfobacterales bacterium CG23_combo_of_CG06-09_8_20_14_all_51_8]
MQGVRIASHIQKPGFLTADQRDQFFKRHLQGAFVRIAAIVLIWSFLLNFYLFHIIDTISFIGISISGGAVIFFNFPFLLGLKKIIRRKTYEAYNLLINIVEILGDTFIIYFLGGIKGMYLIGIYAGLIAYVGVVAPVRYPYIIATLCSVFFGIMAFLEHSRVIPHMNNQWGYTYTTTEVVLIVLILSATLYVLAFNSSYTSSLLRKARKKLSDQNQNLENSYEEINQTADELNLKNIRLKESMDNLHQAQSQLVESEKMAALGGLVAGVAHEINTPVGVGVTAASFLQDKINALIDIQTRKGASKDEINQFLKTASEASLMIYKNLNRAAELVKNFKQVAVDQFSEASRTFNLKEYIDGVLLSMHYQYKRSGHSIQVNCPDDFVIDSYPGVFSQITTNLVMNSLIHGFEGMARGEIVFDISADNGHLDFHYRDNGKGMSEETVKRIFEPFYTTKRGQGGSGLGMHIVYNIVTQTLGGTIKCASTAGSGVSFDIRIPLKKGDR